MKLITRKSSTEERIMCFLIFVFFLIIAFLTPGISKLSRLFPQYIIPVAIAIVILQLLTLVNSNIHQIFSGTEIISSPGHINKDSKEG